MSTVVYVDIEIMCMEAFGAQNGMELKCILEKCVLACLTKPRQGSTVGSTSKLNESSHLAEGGGSDTD